MQNEYETNFNDPGPVTRGERGRLARVFIAESLLPAVSQLKRFKTLSSHQLDDLLSNFQEANPVQGSDFDMGVVQTQVLNMRLEYASLEEKGRKQVDHKLIDKAFNIIEKYRPR